MNELATAIQEASSVIILLPDNASDKDYLAALQLLKLAPEKTHLVAPETKERAWGTPPAKKEFAITIDTTLAPVEELRYEKNDGALIIYLSHRSTFRKDSIAMGEYLPKADLIVTAGFANLAEAEAAIDILNQKNGARHIWLDEYNAASEPNQTAERLTPPSASLLGRLMARSREDIDMDIMWAFLIREDFEKTQSSPDELQKLIESYESIARLPSATALFWQYGQNSATYGLLWSRDMRLLDRVAAELGMEDAYSNIIKFDTFQNFIDAEVETRKLLRKVL